VRKTLSCVGFDHALGSSALFRLSGASSTTPSAATKPLSLCHQSPAQLNQQLDDTLPRAGDASGFLGSLRATTLLDYGFMREFSLLKRKPLRDRNLSRLSTESVYSMRTTQLALEQQGKRELTGIREWKTATPLIPHGSSAGVRASSKSVDETRLPIPTSSSPRNANFSPASRSSGNNSTIQPIPPTESLREPVVLTNRTDFTRSKQTAVPSPSPPQQQLYHVPSRPQRPSQHQHSERPAGKPDAVLSPKSAVLLWRDLSEFDLRKCHPAVVIAELHGHLQEQDVAALCASTGYNRTELFALWARFKALCSIAVSPRGIDKDTFRRGLPQLALEDEFFIDRVFDILDADGSGILEWPEFIEALSALEKGDSETRVRFLFRVYDLSGDGSIHRSEIQRFFLASLLITPSDDVVAVASHVVDKIFMAVGRETSDTMRVQDALTYMHDNPGSADIYKLLGRTMITNHRLIVDKSAPVGSGTSPVDPR
jgi:Ca2+-binding EF-hand superfamily protein